MPSDELVDALRSADRIVVLTGAGASAESGIPTFRDALTGLWERYDPTRLAAPEAFAADPDLVWGWYVWRRDLVARCSPNAGHEAVARMQAAIRARGGTLDVLTQNVDDLHERAGAHDVVHLHGDITASRCFDCGTPWVGRSAAGRHEPADVPEGGGRRTPPRCPECGGLIRPAIVWFGEMLPTVAWSRAEEAVKSADVLLTIGTSGTVYPVADLPRVARMSGARVVQVNPEATGLEPIVDDDLRARAGEVLPPLVEAAFG